MARAILRRLELVEEAIAESEGDRRRVLGRGAPDRAAADHPGVGEKVAQVIVAETGADMSRFPSAGHLAAWAGLAPAVNESAGRRWTGRHAARQ